MDLTSRILDAIYPRNNGIIAIDGRAASGKTSIANGLCDMLDASIIRMDDFFLPPELKTAQRLSQPGGNIHHERFIDDVLPYLKSGLSFKYRKFDCSKMGYNDILVDVPSRPWRIVEGVYSCHPALGEYMNLRVFVNVTPQEQQSRIKKRNSEQIASMYLEKWIPMEEAYFKAYSIHESADIIIET